MKVAHARGDRESWEHERSSSAITLSDLEMFVFPELLFSLVLANIMSPRIWRWRDDPWFAGIVERVIVDRQDSDGTSDQGNDDDAMDNSLLDDPGYS